MLVETQNLVGVADKTLEAMRERAGRILESASIRSTWVAMGVPKLHEASQERRIFVRLVSSRHSFSANRLCLGEALVADGGGNLAVVYVDRVRDFAQRYHLPLDLALAYTAVHEVGHLLLGNTAHSRDGVMRAHWDGADTLAMRTGYLSFAEAEVAAMARNTHRFPKTIARTTPAASEMCLPSRDSHVP